MESRTPSYKIKSKSKLNTCHSLISEIGRWLSVDPLANKYPGWSPYNYCMNEPLGNIYLDGREVCPCSLYENKDSNYKHKVKSVSKKYLTHIKE